MIPRVVDGNKVVEVAHLSETILPLGYTPAQNVEQGLAPVLAFVIALGEGADGDPVYYVSCLDEQGARVTGDMYYTLEAARGLPSDEFGIDVTWSPV